jgi:hypothetical protein
MAVLFLGDVALNQHFHFKKVVYFVNVLSWSPMSQIDFIVPSSDAPHKREWTAHYWYYIFAAGLQAKATLTDGEAELLVQSFRALEVTLCCPQCKAHFKEYFQKTPYTVAHARDTRASLAWIRNLRVSIQNRLEAASARALGDAVDVDQCVIPRFPGSVYPEQVPAAVQKKTDLARLDAAIANALEGCAKHLKQTAPCNCALEGKTYDKPTWSPGEVVRGGKKKPNAVL